MAVTDLKPTPKMAATGISGAAATILVVVAKALGLDLPPEAAAALVLLAAYVAGFWKKDSSSPVKATP